MKLETLILAGFEAAALQSRTLIPVLLILSTAASCAGGSSTDSHALAGGTIENAGGDGGSEGGSLNEGGLVGSGAAGGSENLPAAGSAGGAGASGGGTSDAVSSTDCAALPRRAARYSGTAETPEGANCGVWALSIVPEGAGNAYVLARAERDSANPLLTVDAALVLTGPVVASSCTNDAIARQAVFSGAGLGPEPFLETSFSVEYFQSTNESIVNVALDTHLAAGSVNCEGALVLELPSQR